MTPNERRAAQQSLKDNPSNVLLLEAIQALRSSIMEAAAVELPTPIVQVPAPPPAQVTVQPVNLDPLLQAVQELAVLVATAPAVTVPAVDWAPILAALRSLPAPVVHVEAPAPSQVLPDNFMERLVDAIQQAMPRGGRISSGGPVRGALTDSQLRANPVVVTFAADAEATPVSLTFRMFEKAPAADYELWHDTASTDRIILAEAPADQADTSVALWRGIAIPLDADGNDIGHIQERTGFSWDDRHDGW